MISKIMKNKQTLIMLLVAVTLISALFAMPIMDVVNKPQTIVDTLSETATSYDYHVNEWTQNGQSVSIPTSKTHITHIEFAGLYLNTEDGSAEEISIIIGVQNEDTDHPDKDANNWDVSWSQTMTVNADEIFSVVWDGAWEIKDHTDPIYIMVAIHPHDAALGWHWCDDVYFGGQNYYSYSWDWNMQAQDRDAIVKVVASEFKDVTPPSQPTFTYSPIPPTTTTFTTFDVSSPVTGVSYRWKFGSDDWTAYSTTHDSYNHLFTTLGTYPVKCQAAYYEAGWTPEYVEGPESSVMNVVVQGGTTTPPIADFDAPTTALVGESVDFDDESIAGTYTINQWYWDFDDGDDSSQPSPSHTFDTSGTYTVELTVTDSQGTSDSYDADIVVSDILYYSDITCIAEDADGNKLSNVFVEFEDYGSDTTRSNGEAYFDDVLYDTAGTSYHVDFTAPGAGGESKRVSVMVNGPTETVTCRFSSAPPPPPNTVNLDIYVTEKDGVTIISGATVSLYKADATLVGTKTTDIGGLAPFTDVPSPATYTIEITVDEETQQVTKSVTQIGDTFDIFIPFELGAAGGAGFVFDTNLIIAIIILAVFSVVGILLSALLPIGIGWRIGILLLCIIIGVVIFLFMTVIKLGVA